MCEGHHHRSSHHSNGLIRFNVHLNHLKWNESLMKTVEPDVVAWSSTNQRTFINKGFQFLRSESKELKCFSERWDISSTTNFCNNAFQFPARWTMICYHFLIFSCFFLIPKGNSLFNWNREFWADKTKLSASRYDKSINLFCSFANILRKVFYWECLEFWKFEENCPIIWGSKISIESLFFLLCVLAELIVEAVAFSFTKWMPGAVSFWLSWLRCWTLRTIALHRTLSTLLCLHVYLSSLGVVLFSTFNTQGQPPIICWKVTLSDFPQSPQLKFFAEPHSRRLFGVGRVLSCEFRTKDSR